ncbi:MAG TPA: DUF5658 family protein [Bryobacteraceae bacterium]|jgi:hypothetical protein|nr:DUF5658 family protein [Bryobacteraceae bacterium]
MTSETRAAIDWSLSLQLFLYLQLLDALTTYLGLRHGLAEASPFVQFLMRVGPVIGLLGSKIVAVLLGAYCVWRARYKVISLINYWYAGLVVWNFALILSR